MVLHVMTETPVPKLIVVSQGHALDRIRSPAARATNVTMPEHAVRKLAFVRTHQSRTALHVMMAIFVLQEILVRRGVAPVHRRPAMVRLELKAIGLVIPKPGACRR